jgi:hypothetical protein
VDSAGTTLPNIAGYRVYRTLKNGANNTEVFLGTADDTDDICDAVEKLRANIDELRGGPS